MDPSRVIRGYLVISGLFTLSASLIWGINTLFLLDAGLSIFEVFVANAAFTAAMALFEVPTGVVADTLGRRTSFLLSEATLAVGTLAYVGVAEIEGGLVLFCLAGVILGLGYTFYSGAVEAWVVDALKATGYHRELDSVFARASIVSSVAMVTGTVGGGVLGQLDLSLPYVVRAALVVMAFAVGFRTMRDIGFTPRALRLRGVVTEMRKVARAGITYGWRTRPVRLLMLTSFLFFGFFSWAWYAWQPYFLDLFGRNAVWLSGLIAALFPLAGIVGSVGGQAGLGYLSQERSVPAGFVVGGLATLLALPLFARLRSLREPADRIREDAPEQAIFAELGGVLLFGFAYLLWVAPDYAVLARRVAEAAALSNGLAAALIALWLASRPSEVQILGWVVMGGLTAAFAVLAWLEARIATL